MDELRYVIDRGAANHVMSDVIRQLFHLPRFVTDIHTGARGTIKLTESHVPKRRLRTVCHLRRVHRSRADVSCTYSDCGFGALYMAESQRSGACDSNDSVNFIVPRAHVCCH